MTQALLDAVAGITDNMQRMRDAQAANHTQTLATLAALKAAIDKAGAGTDPDVAAAIEQLTAASVSVDQTANDINAETQAMAEAVSPAHTPAQAPEPQAAETGPNPSTPAGS